MPQKEKTRLRNRLICEVYQSCGRHKKVFGWPDPEIYSDQWLSPDRERYRAGRFVLNPRLNRSQKGYYGWEGCIEDVAMSMITVGRGHLPDPGMCLDVRAWRCATGGFVVLEWSGILDIDHEPCSTGAMAIGGRAYEINVEQWGE